MNFKTTIVLAILAVAGGLFWLVYPSQRKNAASSETLKILEEEIKPERLQRIEVIYHEHSAVVFERSPDGEWTMPGKWPTRKAEVDQLIDLLTHLRSRFAAIPLGSPPALTGYGLDKPPVEVQVLVDGTDYLLQFGEEPGESNRFSRPTFLRINQGAEAVRLAPGIVAALTRPFGFFQQHRLFPAETVKDSESQDKSEQLSAKGIMVQETKPGDVHFTLNRASEDWQIQEPVHDLPDPDKLKTILTAVPDIWVEKFVENPDKDLTKYGLKDPEHTIQVTKNNGETIALLIGKKSHEEKRTVTRPSPPFAPQQPAKAETIVDEFLFAKLKDNEQIFEIKDAKLKDIFVALDTLRDAHLARFRSFDVNHLEVNHAGQTIVLDKDKGAWKLKKPVEAEAESGKVNELLDKLSGLEAKDMDVIDKGDPKSYGLDKPADTIRVKVEESKGEGEKKTTTTKTFNFALGKRDADKKKLYVRVEGRQRINAVDDSLVKLIEQPVLAYRSKRILDFFSGDLAKLEINRGDQKFTLEQEKDSWRLTSPVKVDADQAKTNQLAGDLGRLEVVEYIANEAKKEDLEKLYGLDKPPVSVTTTFNKKEKTPQTLLLGKQRGDKGEFFAKLASAPGIFVVKKEIHDALDLDSLAFRPRQLWNLKADDIAELNLQKEGQNEHLKREGSSWQIVEPFAAAAVTKEVDKIVNALASPSCVRYEAHVAKELKTYGLDKPYLRVALTTAEKKDETKPKDDGKSKEEGRPKEETKAKEKSKEHVLLIGKPTAEGQKTRFAKLGDAEAVFVIDQNVASAVDQNALDLLDRDLLKLDTQAISRIQTTSGGTTLTLQRDKDYWRVASAAAQFTADREVMAGVLKVFSNLRAERFAAYGPKVAPSVYGLDKPTATINVSLTPKAESPGGKNKGMMEHALILGKPVDIDPNARYARLDNGPSVFVLSADQVVELTRPELDFVDRNLLKFDASAVTGLEVKEGNSELVLVKREDAWHLIKPTPLRADDQIVEQLLGQLSHLRATRVAAYPAKDLKPFGLDASAKVVTVRLGNKSSVLKIGKAIDEKKLRPQGPFAPDRFAQVEGSNVVAVLEANQAGHFTVSPLSFRDHNLARFADADRAALERGPRKAVFAKIEGTWKLTEPIQADAEQSELEELINSLARLRADELVADKPVDLKPFGLDKPQAHWHLYSAEKEVLDLLIGHRRPPKGDGDRSCYAKLAGGDVVFMLDSRLTAKVLGEYRTRNVWPSLDSAQVDRISFGYVQNPFMLEKTENTWHVQGKPGVQIKPEAVTETLDALARLKVERYVVDKNADWKLYGLEPPQLVLEIQTPSEKKVLQVGRTEGQTKRYYARVPEPNRSDVFIIGETDAAQIVRQLSAFSK